MLFGICTSAANGPAVKAAGWDYVEDNVQSLLVPGEAEWAVPKELALPVPAANVMVPPGIKIVGPEVDADRLHRHMATVLRRAKEVGISTIVFGSGGARKIPEGFYKDEASKQIVAFGKMIAAMAAEQGIVIVLEPLNQGECNIINSVAEASRYVKAIDHANFQCLVDTYHFWLEDESLENLRRAMPMIKHVHLADKEGRVAPGLSGKSDYRPVFKVLKQAGYDGRMSFEGTAMPDFERTAPMVLEFVKRQWAEA